MGVDCCCCCCSHLAVASFANPIENGQCADSMPDDVALMQRRSYVLSKKVAGLVHRCSHRIIADTLPPKHESIIAIKLTPVQVRAFAIGSPFWLSTRIST